MAKFENKEGFKNIIEVRNFLSGLINRKNSKVYVNIEQHDGYNYICVWLDNNLTLEEINGNEAYLKVINGFKKHYEIKMNKVNYEDTSYTEAVQDITTVVWDMVKDDLDGTDSREVFSLCRSWAEEFEKYWNSLVEQGVEDDHDYMLEVEEFAEKKANEYLGRK